MANKFTGSGISTNLTIYASQVSQSVDAFTAAEEYDIAISGTLAMTGSLYLKNGGVDLSQATNGITGSSISSSLTGSLLGTSSYASTASYVESSSYALSSSHAITASYAANSTSDFPYSGSAHITGSLIVTGSTIISSSSPTLNISTGSNGLFFNGFGGLGISSSRKMEIRSFEGLNFNVSNGITFKDYDGNNMFGVEPSYIAFHKPISLHSVTSSVDISSSANFYSKTGSFNHVSVTGSIALTGSPDSFTMNGGGIQRITISSSNNAAIVKLVGTQNSYIDMDEGDGVNRWVAGLYYLDDSYRLASGSAFADNTLFKVSQSSEVWMKGHVSASAFSSSVGFSGSFRGDGSGLTGIAAGAAAAGADGAIQFTSGSSLSGSATNFKFLSASNELHYSGSSSVTGSLGLSGSLTISSSDVPLIIEGPNSGNIFLRGNNSSNTGTSVIKFLNKDGNYLARIEGYMGGASVAPTLKLDAGDTGGYGNSRTGFTLNGKTKIIETTGSMDVTGSFISSSGDIVLGSNTKFAGTTGAAQYMFSNVSAVTSGGYSLGFLLASGSDVGGTIMKISGSGGDSFVGIGMPYTTALHQALTVSGSISASGDVYIEGGKKIYTENDNDTYLQSDSSDRLRSVVGAKQMFLLDQGTGDRAVFGFGTKVGINIGNDTTPNADFHVSGDTHLSGSTILTGSFKLIDGNQQNNYVLTSDANGVGTWQASSGGGGATAAGRDGELQFVSGSSLSGSNGITFNSASMATTVSGSLSVTGSVNLTGSSSPTTSSLVLGVVGSGSMSGSNIFEVNGSVGTLFSVADGLSGSLFEANNISGLPVIQAKSDNTVRLGKYGGYGIVISGSTPDPANLNANIIITGSVFQTGSFNLSSSITISETGSGHFSGSFEGDGSRLSGVSAFPFNGDAIISGSLTVSGSFHSFILDSDDVVLGTGAGTGMTTAAENSIFIGVNAASGGVTGDNNIVMGTDAGKGLTSGQKNVMIGWKVGEDGVAGGASYNIMIGSEVGKTLNGGQFNTCLGHRAGYGLVGQNYNVMIGTNAGYASQAASAVFIGYNAGDEDDSTGNVSIGYNAGQGTSRAGNVWVGYQAGTGDGTKNTSTGYNTGIGYEALKDIDDGGEYNVALGYRAGQNVSTGAKNIVIGNGAAATLSTGDGNIIIGDTVDVSAAGAISELKIGSGSVVPISASLNTGNVIFPASVSGSTFSGSFVGDGSGLTGISGGGGTAAAGRDGEIQFASGSTFSGSNAILFNSASTSTTISGSLITSGSTNITGSLSVTGSFEATTKSFVINHPIKEGYKLQYGVLEGPEHAVYVRGELKENNIITLPDHWKGLVHEDSLTVQLTAIGKPCIHYVDEIKDYEVYIGCEDGLPHCYYFIQGERKDVGKLKTELE